MLRFLLPSILGLASLSSPPVSSGELKVLPIEATLAGPRVSQRLIALGQDKGRIVGDLTSKTEFSSSNPAVATVDGGGIVRSVGDGEAIITATSDGKQATAKVKVVGSKAPFTWTFRNHVIPVLTKIGCNSGACHGALAGKGGLKLSLRGYAPADDHFVLTRQAGARRVDRQEPAKSLFLQKPLRKLPHGGGKKLEEESDDYRVLPDWSTAGATGPAADDLRRAPIEMY